MLLVKFVVDDILAPRRPKHSGTSAFIGSCRALENLALGFWDASRMRLHRLPMSSNIDSFRFLHLVPPFGRFMNIFILPFSHLGIFATMYSNPIRITAGIIPPNGRGCQLPNGRKYEKIFISRYLAKR